MRNRVPVFWGEKTTLKVRFFGADAREKQELKDSISTLTVAVKELASEFALAKKVSE